MMVTAGVRTWRAAAMCRDMDPDIFFPDRSDEAAIERAKAICRSCPVIEECRDYALRAHERAGVWGGMSETERNRRRR